MPCYIHRPKSISIHTLICISESEMLLFVTNSDADSDVRPVSWQSLPSFASEDSDCLVMLPDSQRTFQQTRSVGLAMKPKTVPGHLLIGNALVVDHPSLGSIRSAGTREYQ